MLMPAYATLKGVTPSDLIHVATRIIISRALPRCIPGTNKFALVCRSWCEASNSRAFDEQLQLFLDPDNITERDLRSCLAWLQQHGSCVGGLTADCLYEHWPSIEQALFRPTVFSSNLTHLDLGDTNLLSLLPHLQQLPPLRHLGMYISCVTTSDPWQLCDGNSVAEVPDLGLLCPQLVSLHLVAVPHARGPQGYYEDHHAHPQLLLLLPDSLQRLHVEAEHFTWQGPHFTHLSALVHLTLDVCGLLCDRWVGGKHQDE
jgi:hypothetical protein